jgi:hypothetical protein
MRELMAVFPILSRTMGEFQCSMTARYNGYMSAQIEQHKVNEVEEANDQGKEGLHEFISRPFKREIWTTSRPNVASCSRVTGASPA